MSTEIVPAASAHIEPMAKLAAERVARLHAAVPELGPAPIDRDRHRSQLERIVGAGPAVVAMRDGRVVGFLAAWSGTGRGLRWAFSPEWANGAAGDDPRRTMESLYSRAAAGWLAAGIRTHLIAVPVSEPGALETLSWLGFGRAVADAVRVVSPVEREGVARVAVRPAGDGDVESIASLERGLRAHLAATPVFFILGPERTMEEQRRRVADPASATFLAALEPEAPPIAYLRIGPAADDAAGVIRDPGTASITGAFTLADRRGEGVATALLEAALAWARDRGYVRCAVDFEAMNVEARRFWLRWFTPIVLTMARRLDDPGR